MKKRVFIIHGWESYPEEGWFPWLKKELEQRGFEVFVPAMPNPAEPKRETWIPFLSQIVGKPDSQTYFVGHSIGCQTIIRYLQTLPEGAKIGGAVFVAGWFHLVNLEDLEEERIAKPWIGNEINMGKVKSTAKNFIAIFSDNDGYVPLSDKDIFERELGAKIIIEHGKGHFTGGDDGITELPIVLESILKMSK